MKHKARYKLWLCVGYELGRGRVVAVDLVSAETSNAAARAFMEQPVLADARIASCDVTHAATGRLEPTWRALKFARDAQYEEVAPVGIAADEEPPPPMEPAFSPPPARPLAEYERVLLQDPAAQSASARAGSPAAATRRSRHRARGRFS